MKRKNRTYTQEEKEQILKRVLPPNNESLSKVSKETGITKSTISTWKTKALEKRTIGKDKRTVKSNEKFKVVMEIYTMNEIELSKYCRENGYYIEEVKEWRQKCLEANDREVKREENYKKKYTELKQQHKETVKDLNYKEKALAETAALLVLKKKLKKIYNEPEED